MSIRKATHAGSWYSNSPNRLTSQLDSWLADVPSTNHNAVRAIISPHAGYSYCGATAAFAYKQIDPLTVRRVFILGPSHHKYLDGCALSQCSAYDTPLGPLPLDKNVIKELQNTGHFTSMTLQTDEEEHSIEMQLPFIRKIMFGCNITVIPILVGSLSPEKERQYGILLAKYLNDANNLWVVSSDFCHWGKRFNYTYQNPSFNSIFESIQDLDHKGMCAISTGDPDIFLAYQKQYKNTICGRHPIAVLLH
eukprot:Ihof_evm5s39 gene=Ihof_evmTU5s39